MSSSFALMLLLLITGKNVVYTMNEYFHIYISGNGNKIPEDTDHFNVMIASIALKRL